jgi:hypothetical protein
MLKIAHELPFDNQWRADGGKHFPYIDSGCHSLIRSNREKTALGYSVYQKDLQYFQA